MFRPAKIRSISDENSVRRRPACPCLKSTAAAERPAGYRGFPFAATGGIQPASRAAPTMSVSARWLNCCKIKSHRPPATAFAPVRCVPAMLDDEKPFTHQRVVTDTRQRLLQPASIMSPFISLRRCGFQFGKPLRMRYHAIQRKIALGRLDFACTPLSDVSVKSFCRRLDQRSASTAIRQSRASFRDNFNNAGWRYFA